MTAAFAPDSATARHWDATYGIRGGGDVSWFQTAPVISLELIEILGVPHDAAIIDIGGGASLLVDHLVDRGFIDLSVLDVSETALQYGRQRLSNNISVSWLREDLRAWQPVRQFDLWHDRAVFHFLVRKEDRDGYLDAMRKGITPGGALVMATFAEDGPENCSGLPVARYSAEDLGSALGEHFEVLETRREMHLTPGGIHQPFTWIAARAKP